MLGVNKTGDTALLLYLGHHMQGNRRLTTGLRPIYLDNAALGNAAYPQRQIQTERTGRHSLNLHVAGISQFHNGTLSIVFFNLCNRRFQRFYFI